MVENASTMRSPKREDCDGSEAPCSENSENLNENDQEFYSPHQSKQNSVQKQLYYKRGESGTAVDENILDEGVHSGTIKLNLSSQKRRPQLSISSQSKRGANNNNLTCSTSNRHNHQTNALTACTN
jgi:hypothetical protein